MNQYQRMVSYLYEYKQGVKGVNVGYVKIEQRGSACRISLQMRGRNLGQIPSVTLFRQEKNGILCFPFCKLSEHGGDYSCRVETDMDNLSGSGISLQEVEGLLLYLSEDYYVATTWKNSEIYLGEMRKWEAGMVSQDSSVPENEQEEVEEESEDLVQENDLHEGKEGQEEAEVQDIPLNGQEQEEQEVQKAKEAKEAQEPQSASENASRQTEVEVQEYREKAERQAICGNCPFQRKNLDYGKRILMSFPAMRPFPNEQNLACVRIEPQDLGCLPMPLWALANNQFLLQGYYCYRHLIFTEAAEKKYALGVPGIYSSRDQEQARRFGFTDFRPICKNRPCMGGFGYWMMPLDISV